jgi:hypothetical protein
MCLQQPSRPPESNKYKDKQHEQHGERMSAGSI